METKLITRLRKEEFEERLRVVKLITNGKRKEPRVEDDDGAMTVENSNGELEKEVRPASNSSLRLLLSNVDSSPL